MGALGGAAVCSQRAASVLAHRRRATALQQWRWSVRLSAPPARSRLRAPRPCGDHSRVDTVDHHDRTHPCVSVPTPAGRRAAGGHAVQSAPAGAAPHCLTWGTTAGGGAFRHRGSYGRRRRRHRSSRRRWCRRLGRCRRRWCGVAATAGAIDPRGHRVGWLPAHLVGGSTANHGRLSRLLSSGGGQSLGETRAWAIRLCSSSPLPPRPRPMARPCRHRHRRYRVDAGQAPSGADCSGASKSEGSCSFWLSTG